MPTFPSSPCARVGSSKTVKNAILKTPFEANYLQVRRTSTRKRLMFDLKYDNITEAEFATLETFFNSYVGTIFDYVYPIDSVTYQVTFQNDQLMFNHTDKGYGNTSIILEGI